MTGHLVGHVVRRTVQHLTSKQQYVQQLQHDAELYENADPDMRATPQDFIPVIVTAVVALLMICSVSNSREDGTNIIQTANATTRSTTLLGRSSPH